MQPYKIVFDDTETMEQLGRKGFCLIQKKNGFRYGEDTVLLSFFAARMASKKRRILKAAELGTNCGAAVFYWQPEEKISQLMEWRFSVMQPAFSKKILHLIIWRTESGHFAVI